MDGGLQSVMLSILHPTQSLSLKMETETYVEVLKGLQFVVLLETGSRNHELLAAVLTGLRTQHHLKAKRPAHSATSSAR